MKKPFKYYELNLLVIYIVITNQKDGWLRLFGKWYGIRYKHKSHRLTFSERSGYKKYINLFNYRLSILPPC